MMNDAEAPRNEYLKVLVDARLALGEFKIDPQVADRLARYAKAVRAERAISFGDSPAAREAADRELRLGSDTGYGPLVGMPCTYEIGSDDYASVVTYVSKSTAKIRIFLHGEEKDFFRGRDGAYRSKGARCGRIYFLRSETKLDPGF